MISSTIINSGRFLTMPHESQALYFHLCLRADDDGVVEALSVLRTTGANEDNLKVLLSKKLITLLNDDLVTYINDWNEHNLLRADRKIDSIYKDILVQVIPKVKLIRAKKRADTKKKTIKRIVNPTDLDTGRPLDNQRTSGGLPRLGKVRLGKVNITTNYIAANATGEEAEFSFWTEKTGTHIRTKFDENIKAAHRLRKTLSNDQFIRAVETIRIVRADRHAGRFLQVIGNYIQLEKNLESIEAYRAGIEDRPQFDTALPKNQIASV